MHDHVLFPECLTVLLITTTVLNQFSGSSGDKNVLFKQTLPWFYQLLTWTSWGKSVATAGKSSLKLVTSQSLKAIRLEWAKLCPSSVWVFNHFKICVVSYGVIILKMAVNTEDLYGNSGNRFNNILAEIFNKKCFTLFTWCVLAYCVFFFPIHCDLSNIFCKLGINCLNSNTNPLYLWPFWGLHRYTYSMIPHVLMIKHSYGAWVACVQMSVKSPNFDSSIFVRFQQITFRF